MCRALVLAPAPPWTHRACACPAPVPCSVLSSPTLPLPAPAEWPCEAATCCLLSPGSPLDCTGLQVVSVPGGLASAPPTSRSAFLQDPRAWQVNSALCPESALRRGSLATHPKPTRSCIFLSVPLPECQLTREGTRLLAHHLPGREKPSAQQDPASPGERAKSGRVLVQSKGDPKSKSSHCRPAWLCPSGSTPMRGNQWGWLCANKALFMAADSYVS